MLDVPVLLAAVSPDSPCGDDLEYDAAFLELERIAQGQPERQMGDAVLPAEPPEWPRVRALASELFGRSKDLRVANLLLQSNVALDGLDGLAEGLLLVRELLGQYWDGVYPLLDADDDNDPTFRINALTGLVAEPLLQLVWAIPLVRSRAFGPVNLRAALNAAGLQRFASETLSPEQIAGAFADADADALAATRRALDGAQEHALAIESGVAERVGSAQGLDLGPLRQLLRQALQVFDLYGPQGAGESLAPGAEAVADEQVGAAPEPQAAVADRKFLEIDVDNFDARLKAMKPRVAFNVPNVLTGEGNLSLDITFESMDDFSPAAVARKVDSLNKLLEARTQLANLLTYMDGKTGAEEMIMKAIKDPALLQALASAPKPKDDEPQA